MATTLDVKTTREAVAVPRASGRGPVVWWAYIGVAALGLQVYLFTRWILSDSFRRIDSGPDEIPLFMRIAAHAHEIIGPTLVVTCLYFFLYRPWRRNGKVPSAGVVFAACYTALWQDFLANYAQVAGNWNTAFWVNRGSWYDFVPGWISPNGNTIPEPVLFSMPLLILYVGLGAVMFPALMRKAKARWPGIGALGLLGVCFGTAIILDTVLELFWIRTGLYFYGGGIPQLTLFYGKYYQLPIYEPLLLGSAWATVGSLCYFTDDKGRTKVERGLDSLPLQSKGRALVRFFAWAGLVNVVILAFSISFIPFTMQPGFKWVKDVESRSYMTNELCGERTDVACPSGNSPIPRQGGGAHLRPDGTWSEPGSLHYP